MTNYRFNVCELHDKPQMNFCFDCGSPLIEIELSDEKILTCKTNTYHVKYLIKPHEGDPEGDCDLFKMVE